MNRVSLSPLEKSEIPTLQRLLQLYYFEATSWSKEQIGADGLYDGCTEEDLLTYIGSSDSAAYLVRVDGVLAGFILMEQVEIGGVLVWELADMFVLPVYRGGWVALDAVRQMHACYELPLAAATFRANTKASRFFQAVIKRLALTSVRQLIEKDRPELMIFVLDQADHSK